MGKRQRGFWVAAFLLVLGGWSRAQEPIHGSVLVQLDGSESRDADGDALVYEWTQVEGPTITLLDAKTSMPKFYAREPGAYRFRLVVSDGAARSEPAFVEVVVERGNTPPVAVVPERVEVTLGESVTLDGSASYDLDGDALTYLWAQVDGPPVMLEGSILRRPALSFTPPREGTYVFSLTLHDGKDESLPAQTTLVVHRPNIPPVARVRTVRKTVVLPVVTVEPLHVHVTENKTLRLGGNVLVRGWVEPDGEGIRYLWRQTAGPEVLSEEFEGASFVFTPRAPGVYIFECIATDGSRQSDPGVSAVTVLGDDVLSMHGGGASLQTGQVRLHGELRRNGGAGDTRTDSPPGRNSERSGLFGRFVRDRGGE